MESRDKIRGDLQLQCEKIGVALGESKILSEAGRRVAVLEKLARRLASLTPDAAAQFSPDSILLLLGYAAQGAGPPALRTRTEHRVSVTLYDLSDKELRAEGRKRSISNADDMPREFLISQIQTHENLIRTTADMAAARCR